MLREQRANLEKLEADATATRGAIQVLEYQARRLRAAEDLPCPRCGKANVGTTRAEFAAAPHIPTVWCDHCGDPSLRAEWLGEPIDPISLRIVYACGFCPEGCYHETREEALECARIMSEDPPPPPEFEEATEASAAECCSVCRLPFLEEGRPRDSGKRGLCLPCAELLRSRGIRDV